MLQSVLSSKLQVEASVLRAVTRNLSPGLQIGPSEKPVVTPVPFFFGDLLLSTWLLRLL